MTVIISVFRKVDISAVSESHVFLPIPGPFTDEDHEVCLKALVGCCCLLVMLRTPLSKSKIAHPNVYNRKGPK